MFRHWARTAAIGFVLSSLVMAGIGCLSFGAGPSDGPDFQATVAAALQSAEDESGSAADKSGGGGSELAATPSQPAGSATAPPTAMGPIGREQSSSSPAATATPSPNAAPDQTAYPTPTSQPKPSSDVSASVAPTMTATVPPPSPAVPTATAQPAPNAGDGRPPPITFAGTLMDGTSFDLNDAVGKPALLVFWAPW